MGSAWEIFKESYSTLWQSYRDAFQKQCTANSIELGIEGGLVTYFLTRIILKKPEKAFKYGSAVFMILPTIYWPICRVQQKKHLEESGVTVVDTQREMVQENPPPIEKQEGQIQVDSA